jgi:hypothetical protein
MRSRLPVLILCLVVLIAAVLRIGTLIDDRTWGDEDYVLLEALGVSPRAPWPSQFLASQVSPTPTLSNGLANLAHGDAYPPLLTVTLFALHGFPNPILAARFLFFVVGLGVVVLVFIAARDLVGPWSAVAAAAYVALSPLLTVASQQIKWSALAPLLATLAGVLLLRCLESSSWTRWALYAAVLVLLLHTHYFCVWIVPAHAVLVGCRARHQLRRFAAMMAVAGALCAPWYLLGLPLQREYVGWYFGDFMAARAHDAWYQPLTVPAVLSSYAYTFFAGLGLQPSLVQTRYLLVLVPLILAGLVAGLRSGTERLRSLAWLGVICMGVALCAQTLYAWRLGHTTPLTASYFVPWLPLFMTAVLLGSLEIRARAVRLGLALLLLGGASANVARFHFPDTIARSGSMSSYRAVADFLSREDVAGTGIVYLRERDAKMMSLFLRSDHLQIIWPAGRAVPPGIDRLLVVASVTAPLLDAGEGWSSPAPLRLFGDTRISLVTRQQPAGVEPSSNPHRAPTPSITKGDTLQLRRGSTSRISANR